MLSSFTLQMPMNVASSATEMATQVFRRARAAAVLSLSLGFLSSSSSTNCIGSGSMVVTPLCPNQKPGQPGPRASISRGVVDREGYLTALKPRMNADYADENERS